jgi:aerobic-type carbon monoxide dehydrogenase small subunit (CoxS/CutS family)
MEHEALRLLFQTRCCDGIEAVATFEFKLNGKRQRVNVDGETPLLRVLRDELELTGTKYGCGEGMCGACTVLVDGKAVRSCVESVSAVAGNDVTTIEGMAAGEELHPLQRAFLEKEAFQCGYCTPGMIMGSAALLAEDPKPSAEAIKQSLEGHICRCGTYPRIVEAVWLASRESADA